MYIFLLAFFNLYDGILDYADAGAEAGEIAEDCVGVMVTGKMAGECAGIRVEPGRRVKDCVQSRIDMARARAAKEGEGVAGGWEPGLGWGEKVGH